MKMKWNGYKLLIALATMSLVIGCATSEPKIQEGPTAEYTFDGLVRVDNTAFQKVWVRKGINLAKYDKIILKGSDVHYRAVRFVGNERIFPVNQEFFPLNEKQKNDVEKIVTEAFKKELEKSKYFKIVEEPGPTTLTVFGTLLDVVSRTPPDSGTRDYYLSSYGEATLVIELRDSESDEVFARVADRRAAQPLGGEVSSFASTSVTASMEVNRLASRWATLLRQGIDYLHDLPEVE